MAGSSDLQLERGAIDLRFRSCPMQRVCFGLDHLANCARMAPFPPSGFYRHRTLHITPFESDLFCVKQNPEEKKERIARWWCNADLFAPQVDYITLLALQKGQILRLARSSCVYE